VNCYGYQRVRTWYVETETGTGPHSFAVCVFSTVSLLDFTSIFNYIYRSIRTNVYRFPWKIFGIFDFQTVVFPVLRNLGNFYLKLVEIS